MIVCKKIKWRREQVKKDKSDLNKREVAILNFISKQIKANQYPPSVREICKAVGLNSTATVHGYLEKLKNILKMGML